MNSITVTVRMDKALHARITKQAVKEGRSISNYIKQIINKHEESKGN